MPGFTLDLHYVELFCKKYQRKLRSGAVIIERTVYLNTALCRKLLDLCITAASDDTLINTVKPRLAAPEEDELVHSNKQPIIVVGNAKQGMYAIRQDGMYFCLTPDKLQTDGVGMVVKYALNISMIFKRFQQYMENTIFLKNVFSS